MLCPYCRTQNLAGATRCAACTSWMVDPPPIREWTRAREGKLIGGVCRGLSQRFAIPVAAVRLVFLLSLLLGGWGLIAYIGLWIAMPLAPPVYPALPTYVPPQPAAGASGGAPPPSL